jgi:hypothetical protein
MGRDILKKEVSFLALNFNRHQKTMLLYRLQSLTLVRGYYTVLR